MILIDISIVFEFPSFEMATTFINSWIRIKGNKPADFAATFDALISTGRVKRNEVIKNAEDPDSFDDSKIMLKGIFNYGIFE